VPSPSRADDQASRQVFYIRIVNTNDEGHHYECTRRGDPCASSELRRAFARYMPTWCGYSGWPSGWGLT